MKAFISVVLTLLGTLAFTTLLAIAAIEWMVGCGETYTDANGQTHQYECVFIPTPKE
jgi:hypothetical protein